MKSFRKVVIASVLAAAPVLAAGGAWANTELVPGARLVAPYWDISGDRSTLLFLTNVSKRADLRRAGSPGAPAAADLNGVCGLGPANPPTTPSGVNCGVHLEFYSKSCDHNDTQVDLSPRDIDQLDLVNDSDMPAGGLDPKFGWVDIDVRRGDATTNATSVQANVLLGTVVITDAGSDFVVAYPMASSIGSANSGLGSGVSSNGGAGDIVSRIGGLANAWTGGYESFPARVFVPMFFAEGTNHGQTFTSTLAIAGPAQAIAGGEAPGQPLDDDPSTADNEGILVRDTAVQILDACENPQSDRLSDHYVIGSLDELFTQDVTAPYQSVCAYPAGDVDRKPVPGGGVVADAFHGGWIDITNRVRGRNTNAGVVGTATVSPGLNIERGLVGVLVQQTTSKGDVTRLWGDCAYGTSTTVLGAEPIAPTVAANASGGLCRPSYSLVDEVNHNDIRP